jgi:formylglycine-generating enzyme required for sulfatase activity
MLHGRPRARRNALAAALACAVAGGVVAVACGFDAQGERTPFVAAQDAAPQLDAFVIPREDDGSLDAGVDAPAPAPRCPQTTRGPMLVQVADAGFCIDATEVTNEQYDAFLAFTDGGAVDGGVPEGGLPGQCNGLTTFGRAAGPALDAAVTKTHPVTRVSWCAAAAFCAWSGKRLCANATHAADAGEWYEACTDLGAHDYAYGPTFVSGNCNEENLVGALEAVGSRPTCEGGVPGLVDMNGNAAEWIGDCSDAGDASACVAQGSDYTTPSTAAKCAVRGVISAGGADAGVGFRCCADGR